MAKKHPKFTCLKPLEGTSPFDKKRKCAVSGLRGIPAEQAGRFVRRCDVKNVGLAYGRWKTPLEGKQSGWMVTHHGKAMLSRPVATKAEALGALGDYMGRLLEECTSCKE